jgi:hypothetical protein
MQCYNVAMTVRLGLLAGIAALALTLASHAYALDRAGAIEVAKKQVGSQCGPCTFDARLDSNKWYVRVDFAKGRPAIFVIDQSGRVVGRIEAKAVKSDLRGTPRKDL